MELHEYLQILKKRWLLIFFITFAVAVSSALVSFFVIKPVYKSDISVIIGKISTGTNNQTDGIDDVLMYQMLVKTYSELAKSRTVAEDAIKNLGLSISPEELKDMISVSSKQETEFLTIEVKSTNAEQAMKLANQLAKSLKQVSLDIKKIDNVQILDSAKLPTVPYSPKPVLNIAVAFLLGLMGSVGLTFLLEYLDNTIKTQNDTEKLLGIPVIGIIPKVEEARRTNTMRDEVLLIKSNKSQTAEAYRTLRTNIQFSSVVKQMKIIVVTSSQPGEGKSTIASNLAVIMAQSGKKVLLMDCDLRKPAIHKKFGTSNDVGLTSALAGERKLVQCINTIDLANFYFTTSGPVPPNPAELLGSSKMKNLIEELKDIFEVILIDAPPVLSVTDPQVLAALSDGVALVASYGEVDRKDTLRAKELIEKVGAKILGVIINKVPDEAEKYNSYYKNEQ